MTPMTQDMAPRVSPEVATALTQRQFGFRFAPQEITGA